MKYDVTRDASIAMGKGARDVRIYGWKNRHVMVMETHEAKGWLVQSMLFGLCFQVGFQVLR